MSNPNFSMNSDNQNFILKGFNSIFIGFYMIVGAFLMHSSIEGFIAENNPMGMLSIEIIETICFFIIILVLVFSMLAIFFSSRRMCRKNGIHLWNDVTKKYFLLFFLMAVGGLFLLLFVKNIEVNYITPLFLGLLGLILAVQNTQRKKQLYFLTVIYLLLAVIVFIIPTYWYSSIFIVGGSFFVYGISVRK